MNCHVTPFVAKYRCTSDLKINFTSLAAALNVLALSDNKRVGTPLRDVKRRNAGRKVLTDRSSVSSKWIAQVEAHVYRQMYVFCLESSFT